MKARERSRASGLDAESRRVSGLMFVFDLPFPPKDVRTCWKHGASLEHFVSKSKKMLQLRGMC